MSWEEFIYSIKDVRLAELGRPVFFLVWLILIAIPLVKIDRSDNICGLDYILFMVAAGVTLIFPLPRSLFKEDLQFGQQVLAIIVFAAIAGIRWGWNVHQFNTLTLAKKKKE